MSEIPTEKYYFLHIPKTAGTSFENVLAMHFASDRIFKVKSTPEFERFGAMSEEERASYELISGHFATPPQAALLPKDERHILTFLRHPVARTVSWYHHFRRHPRHGLHEKAQELPLEEFVAQNIAEGPMKNAQSRFLAVSAGKKPMKLNEDELTEVAKERLEGIEFIGLTERFNDSMLLLAHTFGWKASLETERLYVDPRRANREVTPQAEERIREITACDHAIYEMAQALFEQRYRAMLLDLGFEGAAEPKSEEILDVLDARHRDRLASSGALSRLHVAVDSPLDGDGFYKGEAHHSGATYRWTGPGTSSTIDLPPLEPGRYRLEVRLLRAISLRAIKDCHLVLNGHRLATAAVRDGPAVVLHAMVAESEPRDGVQTLEIHSGDVVSQASLNGGAGDSRRRGLAVESIAMVPYEGSSPEASQARVGCDLASFDVLLDLGRDERDLADLEGVDLEETEGELDGYLESVEELGEEWVALKGWAWNLAGNGPVREILITDADGRPVAMGRVRSRRGDVRYQAPDGQPARTAWRILVARENLPPRGDLRAYGLDRRAGRAVALKRSHKL